VARLRRRGAANAAAAVLLPKPKPAGPRPKPADYEFPWSCQIPELAERYRELFGGVKRRGTFVEVGAYDGDAFSNTSGLADLGWGGLYVEPVPEFAEACAHRHAANKRVAVARCAVGRDAGVVDLYLALGLTTVRPEQVQVYERVEWTRGFHKGERIRVPQFPLDDLLRAARIRPGFDVLVVDVEGAEDAVFDSFSLDEWKPAVVIVELIDHHPDFQQFDDVVLRSKTVRAHVTNAGYSEFWADDVNTIFRRDA
jgi:FkbM family methyltransferase